MIFNGQKFAQEKIEKLKSLATEFQKQKSRPAKVAFLLVGNHPESLVFVRQKIKVGEELGVKTLFLQLPENLHFSLVAEYVRQLGEEKNLDGVVVQLPLPEHLKSETQKIFDLIPLAKDIDGLTSGSFDLLKKGQHCFWPAAVRATFEVIKENKLIKLDNKVAVVGARGWVGQRIAAVLRQESSVSQVGEIDLDLPRRLGELRQADLVISAAGRPGLIKKEMIKKGAAVIDLGVMVVETNKGKVRGDVEPEVGKVAGFLTPVPGGIGPVTVACLFENLLETQAF